MVLIVGFDGLFVVNKLHCSKLTLNRRFLSKLVVMATLIGLFFLQAGCFSQYPVTEVRERSEAKWQALVAGDYDKAYGYLSPGFRLKLDKIAFHNRYRNKLTFHSATVTRVECRKDICELDVELDYTIHAMPPFAIDFRRPEIRTEKWILSEGDWWFVPKK